MCDPLSRHKDHYPFSASATASEIHLTSPNIVNVARCTVNQPDMQQLFQQSANKAALQRNFGVRGLLAYIGPGLVRWSGGSRVIGARGRG
jgi:hypothetical protein